MPSTYPPERADEAVMALIYCSLARGSLHFTREGIMLADPEAIFNEIQCEGKVLLKIDQARMHTCVCSALPVSLQNSFAMSVARNDCPQHCRRRNRQ